ncbi:hypothetical protein T4B_3401 [Trichinella pseudospiralis]|uniref:Uncharacterized protein n=2 Tax=Trichinella pseudospiralis TaxID=6337 RepID=A0A0V1FLZ5_TRIPS|nr:hypothetical protein T4A_7653 [Trichinella pseudospiralis]KRY87010.1 hypothetical protein T4D_15326 [Trichinella pseudospiralis]KRZ21864.1 hypothetical protein T4B_3401 [Trichinella pseudospiralis]KRZ39069.1 hypothetical protein T4C_4857 [Trichinella pseudospiralis]
MVAVGATVATVAVVATVTTVITITTATTTITSRLLPDVDLSIAGSRRRLVVELRWNLRLDEKWTGFRSGRRRWNHERVSETNASDMLVRQTEPDRHCERRRSAHVRLDHHVFEDNVEKQQRTTITTTPVVKTTQPLHSWRAHVAVATNVAKYLHNTPGQQMKRNFNYSCCRLLTSPPAGQASSSLQSTKLGHTNAFVCSACL